jgi:hypothetical protein
VKFYDQYRDLCQALAELGIGDGLSINIDAPFPAKYSKSFVGIGLSEQQLQHRYDYISSDVVLLALLVESLRNPNRCYLLNKWMGAIFANYHRFPTKAQVSTRVYSLSTRYVDYKLTDCSLGVCCCTAAHFGVFVAERQRRGGRAKQGAHSFAVRVTLQHAFTDIGNVSIVVVSCQLVAIAHCT